MLSKSIQRASDRHTRTNTAIEQRQHGRCKQVRSGLRPSGGIALEDKAPASVLLEEHVTLSTTRSEWSR